MGFQRYNGKDKNRKKDTKVARLHDTDSTLKRGQGVIARGSMTSKKG